MIVTCSWCLQNDLGIWGLEQPQHAGRIISSHVPALAARISDMAAEFMAMFSVEVVNGVIPAPQQDFSDARKAATAELLEAAAAKVFWDQELPLPCGSYKRVSGI